MRQLFTRIRTEQAGAAAAEMALVAPMLITLMFGSFELGNYFLSEHALAKAVRDGARYATRIPITNYSCPSGSASGSITGGETEIKNVTRTGSIDASASPRLSYWTSNTNTVFVTVKCVSPSTYTGIYSSGMPGDIPVVTVRAAVNYPSLFARVGLANTSLSLNAESEAAVVGI